MGFREDVPRAFDGHNVFAVALSKIAKGRGDNGRALGGETARQLARDALIERKLDWNHVLKVHAEFVPILKDLAPNR